MPNITQDKSATSKFAKLLETKPMEFPKLGDVVKGTVVSTAKNEVKIDINGILTGVVRGREMFNEAEEYSRLRPGDEIEATVLDLENENGEIELSFRYAGQMKAWDNLREAKDSGKAVVVKVTDANKGGLMVRLGSIKGFLPVSQLTPEHYPRVEGGDKNKILEILKGYIGKDFTAKVMDADEKEDKLIVSEKLAWEENQKEVMAKYKVGQHVKGIVTAVTDFGVFVEFDNKMEGLVHISELAWQRIDNPRDLVKVGDEVSAEIINIDGTKIFLSMKKLKDDPWTRVSDRYKIGDTVEGKVLKINPFGLFVELDPEIHGLAHVSELSDKQNANPMEIAKIGEKMKFKIVSIEPKDHRLGLSLKTSVKKEEAEEKTEKEEKPSKKKETAVKEKEPAEKKPKKTAKKKE